MQADQSVSTEQRALFSRILASGAFHKSARSRQLLEYLGEKYFLGQGEPIHEARIGAELFGRGEDFDPSADSIVRASMRQLRARLVEFHADEGCGEAWVVQVPKGDYRLCFEPRAHSPATPHISAEPIAAAKPTPPAPATPQPWQREHRPELYAIAILVTAIAFVLLGGWSRLVGLPVVAQSPSAPPIRHDSVIEHFLEGTTGPVYFVPSDSVINLIQTFSKEEVSFEDYQSRRPFALDHPAALRDPQYWRGLVSRELLNIGDASIALRAVRDYPKHGQRVAFRQSRDLQARDLRSGNYVFLGSLNSNPWVEVFESNLNFQFQRGAAGEPGRWRNAAPRKGERLWYSPGIEGAPKGRSHARVVAVTNLSHSGRVLLVGGITQPDTEAAGEFVLAPDSARTLSSALGLSGLAEARGFEVILRTEQTGNAWRATEVVAHRILPTRAFHTAKAGRSALALR